MSRTTRKSALVVKGNGAASKMTEYVIVQFESGDEGSSSKEKAQSVELPAEENGTLLLTVLQSQYEGATGLKYRYVLI